MIVILMKMNVGFVGLGKMGAPMTRNLLMARNIVNIYDKNLSNIEPLLELGANKQDSPKDVGKASDCIFIMVYPPEEVSNIIFDESEGLLPGIVSKVRNSENNKYSIIIDGGNADYLRSIEIGKELEKYGIRYMDVGFSGGPPEAEKKNLAAFVGGDYDVFNQILPLLLPLCNEDKINYVGEIGSGHFAKVIAHNTLEYCIMGAIGEIASLSNQAGDHKKIMQAVNDGLAQSRLGTLYLNLINEDIESTGCRIGFTQNAAELALREAKKYNIATPLITFIYYLRKISEELYTSDSINNTTKNKMIQDIVEQLDMFVREQKSTGTIRSMAIQAQLRKAFGGHSVEKRKDPHAKHEVE